MSYKNKYLIAGLILVIIFWTYLYLKTFINILNVSSNVIFLGIISLFLLPFVIVYSLYKNKEILTMLAISSTIVIFLINNSLEVVKKKDSIIFTNTYNCSIANSIIYNLSNISKNLSLLNFTIEVYFENLTLLSEKEFLNMFKMQQANNLINTIFGINIRGANVEFYNEELLAISKEIKTICMELLILDKPEKKLVKVYNKK